MTPLLALAGACRMWQGGLSDPDPVSPRLPSALDASVVSTSSTGAAVDAARGGPGSAKGNDRKGDDVSTLPASLAGPPSRIGCADGTREGFLSLEAWPEIAACSGAWGIPGLLSRMALAPQCDRNAGNTGTFETCSVADLCAEGWHVCLDGDDVAAHSASECEGVASPRTAVFFVTRAAATVDGICRRDGTLANDLHGCGSLGQPAGEGCAPLERRFSFADCAASGGVWSCGNAADPHNEANLVVKRSVEKGGALCCRDR